MQVHWLEQSTGDVPASDDWLSPSEHQILRGLSFPKRRADWRLGRWTAKHAVAAYLKLPSALETLTAIELRPAASGAPDVFLDGKPANLALSLSHRGGVAACALAPEGALVGCDLELVEPRIEAFVTDYFTTQEQTAIAESAMPERDRLITILWSAKESVLKALRTGLRLDTRDLSAVLGRTPQEATKPAAGRSSSSSLADSHAVESWSPLLVSHTGQQDFAGWWRCVGGLVRTVVSLPPAGPPIRQ
jgi:4'-phosphopantetheinyl transferase